MKNRWLVPALAFQLVLSAAAAQADSVNVLAGDASWHGFQTPSTIGTAFWNRWSFDGDNHDCNIGYWLSGTAGCSAIGGQFLIDSPNITPEYLGDAHTTWEMQKAAGTESVTVRTFVQVTAYAKLDEFGWYSLDDPTSLNPLFTGVGIANSSVTFFPTGGYGFYVRSPEGTYLSNGTGDTRTHFAVFRVNQNGSYLIGTEDMWRGADWDYNDVIYGVTTHLVPEPVSLALFGCGLVGLAFVIRRRRRT